jgi:hypothetical protein
LSLETRNVRVEAKRRAHCFPKRTETKISLQRLLTFIPMSSLRDKHGNRQSQDAAAGSINSAKGSSSKSIAVGCHSYNRWNLFFFVLLLPSSICPSAAFAANFHVSPAARTTKTTTLTPANRSQLFKKQRSAVVQTALLQNPRNDDDTAANAKSNSERDEIPNANEHKDSSSLESTGVSNGESRGKNPELAALRGGGDGTAPAPLLGTSRSGSLPPPPQPTLAQYRNFALPCLALWVAGPLLSLVDTSFIGLSGSSSRSAQNLAALGPATTL